MIGAILGITSYGIILFLIGYAVGKHHERLAWNKLIKEGRIPKPHEHGYRCVVGNIRFEE